jgi:hypothetical protein
VSSDFFSHLPSPAEVEVVDPLHSLPPDPGLGQSAISSRDPWRVSDVESSKAVMFVLHWRFHPPRLKLVQISLRHRCMLSKLLEGFEQSLDLVRGGWRHGPTVRVPTCQPVFVRFH